MPASKARGLRQPAVAHGRQPPVKLAAAVPRGPANLPPKLARAARAIHRAIPQVTDDLEKFRFNRGVARIRELTNAIEDLGR